MKWLTLKYKYKYKCEQQAETVKSARRKECDHVCSAKPKKLSLTFGATVNCHICLSISSLPVSVEIQCTSTSTL